VKNLTDSRFIYSLVRIQKKISEGMKMMEYFSMKKWDFRSPSAKIIKESLSTEDKMVFPTDEKNFDVQAYMNGVLLGSRQYVLQEPLSSLPKARMQRKM
jgi:alcohol-forming fatty acyl-CoA reductase